MRGGAGDASYGCGYPAVITHRTTNTVQDLPTLAEVGCGYIYMQTDRQQKLDK